MDDILSDNNRADTAVGVRDDGNLSDDCLSQLSAISSESSQSSINDIGQPPSCRFQPIEAAQNIEGTSGNNNAFDRNPQSTGYLKRMCLPMVGVGPSLASWPITTETSRFKSTVPEDPTTPTEEEHPEEGISLNPIFRSPFSQPPRSSGHHDVPNGLCRGPFSNRQGVVQKFAPLPALRTQHSLESGTGSVNPFQFNRMGLSNPQGRHSGTGTGMDQKFASLQQPTNERFQRDFRTLQTNWSNEPARIPQGALFPINNRPIPRLLAHVPNQKAVTKGIKIWIGFLFLCYLVLGMAAVLFVAGPSKFLVFERGFYVSLEESSTLLHPIPIGYSIYIIFHIWNLVWVSWSLPFLFQTSVKKSGCFRSLPPVLSRSVYADMSFGIIAQILWMASWDQNISYASLWLLGVQLLAFLFALVVFSSNMVTHCEFLERNFHPEYCFLKVVCQNGVAGLFAISTNEFVLTLNQLLSNGELYYLNEDHASTLVLALVSIILLVYFVMDAFIFEKAARFVITPYICITWSSTIGLYSNREGLSVTNVMLSSAIVFISAILAGVRFIISLVHHMKSPPSQIPVFDPRFSVAIRDATLTSENL